MKFLSIDKIEEGSHADCEDDLGLKCTIDFCDLPPDAQEGVIIIANADGKWIVDKELTQERKEEILKLRNEIYKTD